MKRLNVRISDELDARIRAFVRALEDDERVPTILANKTAFVAAAVDEALNHHNDAGEYYGQELFLSFCDGSRIEFKSEAK